MTASNRTERVYRFDDVTVDLENFRVQKRGEHRLLTPKAFNLLVFLIEQNGRVLEKQEIFERLWPNAFVGDNALTRVIKEIRQAIGDDAREPRYIETVSKRGYRFAGQIETAKAPEKSAAPTIPSLAVLPFKILSSEETDEYLGFGIADALITRLSNSRKFIVRPTSSILRYRTETQKPAETGRELRVESILEGTIRKAGGQIRFTAQLVDVETENALWAEKFDEQFSDIFTVEDSIAGKVAEALAAHLSGDEKALLTKRYTENVEAYEAYLKGRFYTNKFTLEAFHKAVASFDQSLELDPQYALALAGIAEAHWIASDLYLNPKEAVRIVKETSLKAIEADPQLAEAHTFYAASLVSLDWNWTEGELEFRRAIELNPNFAPAHHWFGWYLTVVGRFDEAIASLEKARRLDPFSLGIYWFLAAAYAFSGQFETAVETTQKLIEIEPYFWGGHWSQGYCYARAGNFERSIAAYEKAAALDDSPMIEGAIAELYALSGKRDEAQIQLAELKEREKTSYVPPYYLALVHAALGERDEAFSYLEIAFETRDNNLPFIKIDQRLDNLRADKRFDRLVARIGLE